MIDTFRQDLDREQMYLVLRALDAYIIAQRAISDDVPRNVTVDDRDTARREILNAEALRKKMARGL